MRIVPDVHDRIVTALNALRSQYDHVFTSGGIGPTHDDITADAIAAAFGVEISVREDARALLEGRSAARGVKINDARLKNGPDPHGASLIVVDSSAAPGFSIQNVHVMAGVPSIFAEMVAAVLPSLEAGRPTVSRELRFDVGEGRIADQLRGLAADFPQLAFGSYPSTRRESMAPTLWCGERTRTWSRWVSRGCRSFAPPPPGPVGPRTVEGMPLTSVTDCPP